MPSRRLILAAATGYTWAQIEPFMRSLRATGFDGTIMMLVARPAPADEAAMRAAGIVLRQVRAVSNRPARSPADLLYNRRFARFFPVAAAPCRLLPLSPERRRLLLARLATFVHHIGCARFFHYHAWLRAHADSFDEVMLTDVRDVLFQADPFARPLSAPQRFCLEHPSATLGSQGTNVGWITRAYGAEALARIAHHPISCAGTTYGTTAGMLDYLAAMTDELVALSPRIAGWDGFDQGVHNYLIRNGRFPSAELCGNERGPVLTMQEIPPQELRLDSAGRLLDVSGAVVPVLHQYDRHAHLRERLVRLLAA